MKWEARDLDVVRADGKARDNRDILAMETLDRGDALIMTDLVHEPVLLQSVEEFFFPLHPGGVICDATLGGGGHTARFLERSQSCRVVGIDVDSQMLARARKRLGDDPRVEFVCGWFDEVLAERSGFDRILIDLGVSMIHMKSPDRGFSLREEGPLDMRLDATGDGLPAAEFILQRSEQELADVIFRYGEERYSRRIAAAIVDARDAKGIHTTADLAEIVRRAVPPAYRRGRTHPATKTFQALRIAVNDELGRLERVLPRAAAALNPGGRLGIITFHSLEDRIVKHRFRDMSREKNSSEPSHMPMVVEEESFRVITRKPIVPSEEERATNPASRSAKLRILERKHPGESQGDRS
ncbi:16S rRNA (cytosine1402-N4)-methyltransferase [Alkalispirochaeta americana]|uniref:Ribosomal RNA small subunit methyltransferase H n=1 Tax=Alkalispirochaeta americana TaxID=159291 RepID=A0A1N6PK73_9SPIO|nr:16S rRNA (cytosine(1402)-N(4))-methyltransferase RsmH [Alkalispirochaeta americana]SIQ04609.1 16S rRNA (cytosine1402-N4)-methyltransferase [Alkalispirochaeta americana]